MGNPDAAWKQAYKEVSQIPLKNIKGDLYQVVAKRAEELRAQWAQEAVRRPVMIDRLIEDWFVSIRDGGPEVARAIFEDFYSRLSFEEVEKAFNDAFSDICEDDALVNALDATIERSSTETKKRLADLYAEKKVNAPEGATHVDYRGMYYIVPDEPDGTFDVWESGQWLSTEASDTALQVMSRLFPVEVDPSVSADIANQKYGESYGVDWVYKAP